LGLEVQEADPWQFIEKDKNIAPKMLESGVYYTVAIGLALREE